MSFCMWGGCLRSIFSSIFSVATSHHFPLHSKFFGKGGELHLGGKCFWLMLDTSFNKSYSSYQGKNALRETSN